MKIYSSKANQNRKLRQKRHSWKTARFNYSIWFTFYTENISHHHTIYFYELYFDLLFMLRYCLWLSKENLFIFFFFFGYLFCNKSSKKIFLNKETIVTLILWLGTILKEIKYFYTFEIYLYSAKKGSRVFVIKEKKTETINKKLFEIHSEHYLRISK